MRTISIIEKQIIDRIVTGETHISTLLTDQIPELILDINRDLSKVTLIIQHQKDQNNIVRIAKKQTETIIYIIKFLLYLENEGYIMTGNFAHGLTVQGKIATKENFDSYNQNPEDYTNWQFTDKRMEQYIFTYSDLTIFPSYLLKIFKKHGYKSKVDQRHNQILWISSIAIFSSWVFGLWSVYQSSLNDNPTHQQIETIIQELRLKQTPDNLPTLQQVDSLISKINEIKK